jgi:hypothetical protein
MDVNKLIKALDNEYNEKLIQLSTKKIKEINKKILLELPISKDKLKTFISKLKDYKYVDELNDLKYGTYIRWINLTNIDNLDNIELTKGAIFCETKITDSGIILICKGFGLYKNFFQLKMEDCLVFQHLTNQEKVLLNALDYLDDK